MRRFGLRKALVASVIATLLGLVMASTASAAGGILNTRARYYSDYVHFIINYDVWASPDECPVDEYGNYTDPDCYDVDSNDATVDIHVYRIRNHHRYLRYSDSTYGFSGKATEDVYSSDIGEPSYGCSGHYTHNYIAVFRLIDPVTENVVDHSDFRFSYYCH